MVASLARPRQVSFPEWWPSGLSSSPTIPSLFSPHGFAVLGVMAATAPAGTHDSDMGCNVRSEGVEDAERPAAQAR